MQIIFVFFPEIYARIFIHFVMFDVFFVKISLLSSDCDPRGQSRETSFTISITMSFLQIEVSIPFDPFEILPTSFTRCVT